MYNACEFVRVMVGRMFDLLGELYECPAPKVCSLLALVPDAIDN